MIISKVLIYDTVNSESLGTPFDTIIEVKPTEGMEVP